MAFMADADTVSLGRQAASLAGLDPLEVHAGALPAAVDHLSAFPAPRILVVDVSDCEDVLQCLDRLADACEQHTRVIAIGAVNDVDLYRRLIDMGLTDYLVKPGSAETLAAALRRARVVESAPAPASSSSSRKIALVGSKGGVGTTSLALSLGYAFAERRPASTLLLDLDLRFGAMAMSLDLEPSRGLREILSTPERIDSLLIESAVTHASGRLRLLSAEEPIDSEILLPGEGLSALLKWVDGHADVIIMDVPRHLDAVGKAALEAADVICLVTDLSLVGMRDTKRIMAIAQAAGGELLVVANRVGGLVGEVPQSDFEQAIGTSLDFVLPNDTKAAADAADSGKSLLEVSTNKKFAEEVERLAARLYANAVQTTEQPAPPSWFSRIFGR